MPRIESYTFGRICIDGRQHRSDVLVFPERVEAGWWREKGHHLQLADLQSVIDCSPDTLIIGTGTFGRMVVSQDLRRQLEEAGLEVVVARTPVAVRKYNESFRERNVVAALHLSC